MWSRRFLPPHPQIICREKITTTHDVCFSNIIVPSRQLRAEELPKVMKAAQLTRAIIAAANVVSTKRAICTVLYIWNTAHNTVQPPEEYPNQTLFCPRRVDWPGRDKGESERFRMRWKSHSSWSYSPQRNHVTQSTLTVENQLNQPSPTWLIILGIFNNSAPQRCGF